MHTGISFQLRMKAEDIEQNTQIQFFVKLEDGAVMPKLGMFRAGARVSHLIPEQYYQFKNGKILTCRNNGLWIEEPVEGQLAVYDEKCCMHRFWIHCRRKQSKIVLRFGSFIINPVQNMRKEESGSHLTDCIKVETTENMHFVRSMQ